MNCSGSQYIIADTGNIGVYSGYEGVGGNKGVEYVRLIGETVRPLKMGLYAHECGFAKVTYEHDCEETDARDQSAEEVVADPGTDCVQE